MQYEVNPLCVLDFYVHESRQRTGCGKRLFEHMLKVQYLEKIKSGFTLVKVKTRSELLIKCCAALQMVQIFKLLAFVFLHWCRWFQTCKVFFHFL